MFGARGGAGEWEKGGGQSMFAVLKMCFDYQCGMDNKILSYIKIKNTLYFSSVSACDIIEFPLSSYMIPNIPVSVHAMTFLFRTFSTSSVLRKKATIYE